MSDFGRSHRLAAVLLLGFASGLPLALTGQALQAWLAIDGVNFATIGFFGLVGVPYTFKFLWAPLMDRFEPPWLGRRRGWLSNLHLGARNPAGGFVMVGKTFKGLTDALLTWQTDTLSSLARSAGNPTDGHVVTVPPSLVIEIAVDGVQRSTRYDGGVALRFARVVRYRPDKTPDQADTIQTVRELG